MRPTSRHLRVLFALLALSGLSAPGPGRVGELASVAPPVSPEIVHVAAELPIRGRVVTERDASAIVGARIELRTARGTARCTTTLESFECSSDAARSLSRDASETDDRRWLVVQRPGYARREVEVRDDDLGAIALTEVAMISGAVVDGSGAGVAGAEVRLVGSGIWPARTLSTSADGRFVWNDVPPGIYELEAVHEADVAEPARGLLVEEASRTTLTLTLGAGAMLIGEVRARGSDAPVVGARVWVATEALSATPRAVTTDASGTFRVSGLRARRHSIRVEAPGYVPSAPIAWSPGRIAHVTLDRGATIRGRVVDDRGRPLEGVELEIIGETHEQQPIAWSEATHALADDVFAAARFGPELATAPLGMIDMRSMAVEEAISRGGDDTSMALGVTGVVPPIPLDEAGGTTEPTAPVVAPGVMPSGVGADGAASVVDVVTRAPRLVTGADGSFDAHDIPCGRVHVIARHAGYATTLSDDLVLSPGSTIEDLQIQLGHGHHLEGEVVDANGRVVEGARIDIRGVHADQPLWLETDRRGHFDADLGDDEVLVTVRHDRGPPLEERVQLTGARTIRLTMPVARHVALTLVDAHHERLHDVLVRVETLDAATGLARTFVSDANGEIDASDLPPGRLRVTVDQAPYAPQVVDLRADELEHSIALTEGAWAEGQILDARDGSAIAGADVMWISEGAPHARSVSSRGDGTFEVRRLPEGAYRMRVVHRGFVTYETPVTVARGRDGGVAVEPVTLEAAVRLEGEVVDRLGRVAEGVAIAVRGSTPESDRRTMTDARGHFVVEGVEPTHVTLHANHVAGGDAMLALDLSSGREPAPALVHLPAIADDEVTGRARHDAPRVALTIEGTQISSIEPGSQAARRGLLPGDTIVSVDGVTDATRFSSLLEGSTLIPALLEIDRDGQHHLVRVARERPRR